MSESENEYEYDSSSDEEVEEEVPTIHDIKFNEVVKEIHNIFEIKWNEEFRDEKQRLELSWFIRYMKEYDIDDNRFQVIHDMIKNDFNVYNTFKMLKYIHNNKYYPTMLKIEFYEDEQNISNMIDSFILCVCYDFNDTTHYSRYQKYLQSIEVDASNKIKEWWKKIYWSPHTKVGIKRFNKECQKLGY